MLQSVIMASNIYTMSNLSRDEYLKYNKNICVINSNIIDICKNEKKYLVEKN